MFQLKKQDNVFERKDQVLKDEATYYAGLSGQLKDEDTIYEEDSPTDSEEQGTDQHGS